MRRVRRVAGALFWLALAGFGLTLLWVLGAMVWFAGDARDEAAYPEADAIVILSAGLDQDGALDAFTRARVARGLALWRAGRAPGLIVSGGPNERTGKNVADEMARALIAAGAPSGAVAVENRAVSTFENARFSYQVATARGWRRLIVVTDDFHLARAAALFWFWRPAGFEIAALSPASGRAAIESPQLVAVLVRETLAYPFNLLKALGQIGLTAIGAGEGRAIR